MPCTRTALLAALSATDPAPDEGSLGYAIRLLRPFYAGLEAGTVEQLAERLALRGWSGTALRPGAFFHDGCSDCGFVGKIILGAPGEFLAAGSHVRRTVTGLAFRGAPG